MRSLSSWVETSLWFASLWGAPLLISLLVCLIWCISVGSEILEFPIRTLTSLTADMVGFLGVVVAVLIAAITTLYSLSSQNRNSGFITFLQGLNQLRQVPDMIKEIKDQVRVEIQEPLYRWYLFTLEIVNELNEVTPDWRGYDSSPQLETRIRRYVSLSTAELGNIVLHSTDNQDDSLTKVSQIRTLGDSSLRSAVIGLRNMDLGVVGNQLVGRLMGLSLSLTLLLMSVLIVRALAGLVEIDLLQFTTWLTVLLYVFVPATAITHIAGFAVAIYWWWTGAQRPRDWERRTD